MYLPNYCSQFVYTYHCLCKKIKLTFHSTKKTVKYFFSTKWVFVLSLWYLVFLHLPPPASPKHRPQPRSYTSLYTFMIGIVLFKLLTITIDYCYTRMVPLTTLKTCDSFYRESWMTSTYKLISGLWIIIYSK